MLQATLFGTLPFTLARIADRARRTMLDDECWIDHVDRWAAGGDDLYLELLGALDWRSHSRWIVDREVIEPRLSTGIARPSAPLCRMAIRLGHHYGQAFTASWANLYRDGNDSVAWHGDRFRPGAEHETVALVSLGGPRTFRVRPRGGGPSHAWNLASGDLLVMGGPRTFRVRPRGGGPSHAWNLASGDLLVMGGPTQHRFEHSVPKASHAPARVSVAFRCPRGREFDPAVVDGPTGRRLEASRL